MSDELKWETIRNEVALPELDEVTVSIVGHLIEKDFPRLDVPQLETVSEIASRVEQIKKLQAELFNLVWQADFEGIPQVSIGKAAGFSRRQVYKYLQKERLLADATRSSILEAGEE